MIEISLLRHMSHHMFYNCDALNKEKKTFRWRTRLTGEASDVFKDMHKRTNPSIKDQIMKFFSYFSVISLFVFAP